MNEVINPFIQIEGLADYCRLKAGQMALDEMLANQQPAQMQDVLMRSRDDLSAELAGTDTARIESAVNSDRSDIEKQVVNFGKSALRQQGLIEFHLLPSASVSQAEIDAVKAQAEQDAQIALSFLEVFGTQTKEGRAYLSLITNGGRLALKPTDEKKPVPHRNTPDRFEDIIDKLRRGELA
jgi:hypothetical protein